jgi:CheY-like chemotaxis protein
MTPSILVVDEDQNMRELLSIHLRNAGYNVHTAADGVEAGYGVLRSRPDLVISDPNMPRLDGFDFVEAMRADAATRDIPVILLTKPVRADHLLSLVEAKVAGGRHSIG